MTRERRKGQSREKSGKWGWIAVMEGKSGVIARGKIDAARRRNGEKEVDIDEGNRERKEVDRRQTRERSQG